VNWRADAAINRANDRGVGSLEIGQSKGKQDADGDSQADNDRHDPGHFDFESPFWVERHCAIVGGS
jgi:hypothetical protein